VVLLSRGMDDLDTRRNGGMVWEADEPDTHDANDETAEESSGESVGIVAHLQNVAEPLANVAAPFVDHIVAPVAGAIGSVLGAAGEAWSINDALIERRLNRRNREPLANLYEVHPEAREASPRELGLRFVPVEEIAGTAVAGAAQRGGDFLPLKPFRGENWEVRWRRIRAANDRLQPLPPIDVIKYDNEYWVVDGHNRVAANLYANGVGLDAMVTELVPLDGQVSERPSHVFSYLGETGELRAAASGHRPAAGMRQGEMHASDEAATIDMPEETDSDPDPREYVDPHTNRAEADRP
jgi:hypothetical protein